MKTRWFVLLTFVLVAVWGLLFTRLGVFFVFDVLGDLGAEERDFDPETGPLALEEALQPFAEITLPAQLEQPSGAVWDAKSESFLVVTDQSELFVLSQDMAQIRSRSLLKRGPRLLRQGALEAVELAAPDRAFIGGELGSLWVLERSSEQPFLWLKTGSMAEEALADFDVQGLAFSPERTELFVSGEEGESEVGVGGQTILVLSAEGTLKRRLTLWSDQLKEPGLSEVAYRSSGAGGRGGLGSLVLSGLAWSGETLLAVSQNHSSVLEIDPQSGEILRALALEGPQDASDLVATRRSGARSLEEPEDESEELVLTVFGDHNLFDARPPSWHLIWPRRTPEGQSL